MGIKTENLTKTYHGLTVLDRISLELESGKVYSLMAPSGTGKTTLLRILMGLETSDSGSVWLNDILTQKDGKILRKGPEITAVFQENRLCMGLSAVQNLEMIRHGLSREELVQELSRLLPAESLWKPVAEYSGGMRRRAAVLRAVLGKSELIFMDEPFNGLDEEIREKTMEYVLEHLNGRTLLFTTHREEESEAMRAQLIRWTK